MLVVNKAEGLAAGARRQPNSTSSALGEPLPDLGRARRQRARMVEIGALARVRADAPSETDDPRGRRRGAIKVAIVGRPNVGKSTLVNALLGEERVIAFDQPGTTRDAIYLDFERDGRRYTLIDTAGVRRRGKVFEAVEKFSVIKTMQAIEDANVVVLLLDAQDEHHRAGRAPRRAHPRGRARAGRRRQQVGRRPPGAAATRSSASSTASSPSSSFAEQHYISAREGRGIDALLRSVDAARTPPRWRSCPTPRLTRDARSRPSSASSRRARAWCGRSCAMPTRGA